MARSNAIGTSRGAMPWSWGSFVRERASPSLRGVGRICRADVDGVRSIGRDMVAEEADTVEVAVGVWRSGALGAGVGAGAAIVTD